MSHDDEAAATPRGARQRGPAPLERPSLFAEFDQDHVEDIEPQRVRLLSTLESQRGRSRRPRHKRAASGLGGTWTTQALAVVMGLGMLIVLFSFIEVLRRPPPALVAPAAGTATAKATAATAAAATPPKAHPPAEIQAAEIIDTAPQAASPAPPSPALPAPAAAASSPTATLLATAAADVARLNAETKGRKAPREAERREGRPRSDDVALLEAMFTHTSQTGSLRGTPAANRKAAGPSSAPAQASDAASTTTSASATESLRQCGGASSADAAVCRARVCVQHPTTPACHVAER